MARFYRDAKILEIGEGTIEVQRHADRPRPRPSGRVSAAARRWQDDRMSRDHWTEVKVAREATLAPSEKAAAKLAAQNKLYVRDRIALLVRRGQLRRGRASWRTRSTRGLPADGVVTGRGAGRRPAGAGGRERPDREGRVVGCADGREDRPDHRGRAARRAADLLADRLRGRPDHRPGRPLPWSTWRGPDLPQPGRAVRQGAADLLPVRPVGGRRRVHPGVLRPGDHGRRQRLDVPRVAADGRDGRRREGDAGGDGRRADARLGLRLR